MGKDQTFCVVQLRPVAGIDQTPLVNPDAFKYLEQHAPQKKKDDAEPMVPPKVIIPLKDVTLKEGQPVVLACKIQGYPKPTVTINI